MWLGWCMGTVAAFLDFVAQVSPESVVMTTYESQDTPDTGTLVKFCEALHEKFGLNEAEREILDMQSILDGEGNERVALTIGDNYGYILSDELIAKVQQSIKPDEDPQWWLDVYKWYWRPVGGVCPFSVLSYCSMLTSPA